MSNKNKATKSKESKQRTKIANSNNRFNYGKKFSKRNNRANINAVQLAFLQQIGEIPGDCHARPIIHGTS